MKNKVLYFLAAAPPELCYSGQLASQPGASSWLTCRPMKCHGFALTKGEFRDGIALRYGWLLTGLPSSCACGASFDLCHALSCPNGGFQTLRHNEVRDVTASMLRRVANNVAVEPHLQPITGERFRHRTAISTDQARLYIVAGGVWGGRFERCSFVVRIFNPYAASNRSAHIQSALNKHEAEKRRHYAERVREVEMSGFTVVIPEVASSDSVLAYFHHVFYQFPSLLIRFKFNVSLSCGHPSSIVLPRSGAHFLKSPLFRLSEEWNKLPEHIRCVQSSVNFRIALKAHYSQYRYSLTGIPNFSV